MPDRGDATQEGINLSPTTTTRLIAEAAARQVVLEHLNLCPFAKDRVGERLRNIEISFGRLLGFMIGSGLLGGTAGAIVAKLMP
jgi:hypothetical protein